MEKLEAAVRKLTTDMSELRGEVKSLRVDQEDLRAGLEEVRTGLDEVREGQDELLTAVKGIQKTQFALTNAMTSAIKQLGSDKSLEVRVKRLEDAVFGSKH
ncbi:MAG: hypothetical protein ACOZIN_14320 [Myxococcota bacterium]